MKIRPKRLSEAILRAYLDQALPARELAQVEHDLAQAAAPQAALVRLRRDMEETGQTLSLLTPTDFDRSPALPALKRLQATLATQPRGFIKLHWIKLHWLERILAMFSKSFIKRHQSAVTALTLILLLVVTFSFAPIRAMAGDFLKIFRVREVKVIPVNVEHLENMENNQELSSLLEQFSPETEAVVDGGEPQEVASLSEAAARVDFPIAEATNLPAGAGSLNKIAVLDRSVHQLQLDPDLAEAIFEAAGIEIDLPASLKETPIILTRPAMVLQSWGSEDEAGLRFVQLRSPEIEYPEDLDLNELGVAILQFLGRSEEEAIAQAAAIDWANTLILPIPSDANVTTTEVSIDGAPGTLFLEDDGAANAVMWQKDGLTYMVTGPYAADQILEIAKSVR